MGRDAADLDAPRLIASGTALKRHRQHALSSVAYPASLRMSVIGLLHQDVRPFKGGNQSSAVGLAAAMRR